MTVEFNFELVFKGTKDEIKNMVGVINSYNRDSDIRLEFVHINDKMVASSDMTDEYIESLVSLDNITITASGPYGRFDQLKEVDIFQKIAECAPNAEFDGEIRGGTSYDTQTLIAKLESKLLKISISVEDNSAQSDAWCEYFVKNITLKKFKSLFKVSGEDFDKESYIDLMSQIANDYDGLGEMQYDDFVECLESMDLETKMDEEKFDEVMDKIFNDLEIEDACDYSGGWESDDIEFVYDPIAKKEV